MSTSAGRSQANGHVFSPPRPSHQTSLLSSSRPSSSHPSSSHPSSSSPYRSPPGTLTSSASARRSPSLDGPNDSLGSPSSASDATVRGVGRSQSSSPDTLEMSSDHRPDDSSDEKGPHSTNSHHNTGPIDPANVDQSDPVMSDVDDIDLDHHHHRHMLDEDDETDEDDVELGQRERELVDEEEDEETDEDEEDPPADEDYQLNDRDDDENENDEENEDEDEDDDDDSDHVRSNGRSTQRRHSHHRQSSPLPARGGKRKLEAQEAAYIKANPELFGLRRSIESDSDSDDRLARRPPKKRRVDSTRSSKRPSPQTFTESDSDSDSEYGGQRGRSSRKKARRQKQSANGYAEEYALEKRWSNRRAAQIQRGQYQESDLEDEHDEYLLDEDEYDENGVDPSAETNTSPYVEKVLKHRVVDGQALSPHDTFYDFEYFVKWEGQSHLHDTWETAADLKTYRGYRKVENYFRKVILYELEIQFGTDIPPEQKEQYLLDRERDEEALEDYTKVERVVAVRDGEGGEGPEYLVKWKGLTYNECTWEDGRAIQEHFQDKIDQFLDRSARSWVSDRREANPDTRSRMKKLEAQPPYIQGGELRSFQLRGLNFMSINWTRANNVILADEMGLGKTVQSVSFLSWLRNDRGQEGPFLVVAPLSVIPAWCDTFNLWSPDLNYVVYLGPEEGRRIIRENELLMDGNPKKPKFNVLVTSYEYILADWQFLQSVKWQVLAVDEAHRLKNRESQLYMRLFNFGVPCKILITGTPIQNNLAELSALMDFINPGKVHINEDLESLSPEEAQRQLEALHQDIAPFILRRTKETVESDLPPKTEKIIRVELSDVQLEYYKNILTRNYAALSDASNGHKSSLLNIMMELKKISNHPYMFPGVEERVLAGSARREDQIKGLITSSGKMMLLDQLLTKLKKDGHRVLIFSQMVKMLDILGDYLSLRGYKFQRLDGTMAAGPRRLAIGHFNAPESEDFCFLLSTRAGGLGINLMTADTVVIFDSDWNPQADLQAMARAHRIGQKKPVNIYRLVSKETVEEEVLERARNKLLLEYLTIQAGVTDDGQAFREEFNKKGIKMDGPSSSEDIQYVLKMRSQKMFEQSGNQQRLEQLDIESILENAEVTKTKVDDKMNLSSGGIDWDHFMSYTDVKMDELALDWAQIIPAEELANIQADAEQRQNEEYLAQVAQESAPRRAALKGRAALSSSTAATDSDRAERWEKKRRRDRVKEEALTEERARKTDPKRPLTEREQRNLIRAVLRFGSMEKREDDILADARLADRDRGYVRDFVRDLLAACQRAMDDSAQSKQKKNPVAVDPETGKPLVKKDKKAILFDYGELKKVNAETLLERPPQLELLHRVLTGRGGDQQPHKPPLWMSFRVHGANKAANYSVPWGAREDGMLLVGVDRYGFGAWTAIRDDEALGLRDKFFLDEHRLEKKEERTKKGAGDRIKLPGAVHLARRAEYLLSVLQAQHADARGPVRRTQPRGAMKKTMTLLNHRQGGGGGGGSSSSRSDTGSASPGVREKERRREQGGKRRSDEGRDRDSPRPDKRKRVDGQERERHDRERHERHERQERHENGHENGKKKRDLDRRNGLDRHDRHDRHDRYDKHDRHDKHDRQDRLEKPDKLDRHDRQDSSFMVARRKALQRLAEIRRVSETGDEQRLRQDADALLWHRLRPVRASLEAIIHATKDSVRSSKERARIFATELVVVGDFLTRAANGLGDKTNTTPTEKTGPTASAKENVKTTLGLDGTSADVDDDPTLDDMSAHGPQNHAQTDHPKKSTGRGGGGGGVDEERFWAFLAALWPVEDTGGALITGQRLCKMYRLLADKRGTN